METEIPEQSQQNENFVKGDSQDMSLSSMNTATDNLNIQYESSKNSDLQNDKLSETNEQIKPFEKLSNLDSLEKNNESEIQQDETLKKENLLEELKDLPFDYFEEFYDIEYLENNYEIIKTGQQCLLSEETLNEKIERININEYINEIISPQEEQKQKLQRIISSEENGHYQFRKDYSYESSTGKLFLVNKKILEDQNKVFSFVLTKIGLNLFSGKGFSSISLPAFVFEPRSNIQRLAHSFSFAPLYLERAGRSSDIVFQMKNIIIFAITSSIMYTDALKPFNPLLGETFQGKLAGYKIIGEQILPQISAIQYKTNLYEINATIESIVNMKANSVTGSNQGNISVQFSNFNKNTFQILLPEGTLHGVQFGDRFLTLEGKFCVFDYENKILAEVKISPEIVKGGGFLGFGGKQKTPFTYIQGAIYKLNDKFMNKNSKNQLLKKLKDINIKEDVEQTLCKIEGKWNEQIFIDEQLWFDFDKSSPFVVSEEKFGVLPSDSQFRMDLIHMKAGLIDKAQEWKEKIEAGQQFEQNLRDKFKKNYKKQQK